MLNDELLQKMVTNARPNPGPLPRPSFHCPTGNSRSEFLVFGLQCSHMPDIYLGELEQIVLLAVLRLGDEAYAVPILEQIEAQTGRTLARGALYTALDRLEAKGCLRSRLGNPLPERGGRARRYFTVTAAAVQALKHSRLALLRLWDGLEQIR